MTHRDERNVRRVIKPPIPAESGVDAAPPCMVPFRRRPAADSMAPAGASPGDRSEPVFIGWRSREAAGPTSLGRVPLSHVAHHEGKLTDQYRSSGPGTVIRGEAGSSHRPGTPDGVTFMVVRSLAPGERDRIAGH
jgi:hypothetical protein